MIKVAFLLLLSTLSTIAMDDQQPCPWETLPQDVRTLIAKNYGGLKTAGKLLLTSRQQNKQSPEMHKGNPAFSWASQKPNIRTLVKNPLLMSIKKMFIKKIARTFPENFWGVNIVKISRNKKFLVTGGNDNTINIWDTQTGKHIKTLLGHTGAITGIIITNDSKSIISSSCDKTIKIWDIQTQSCTNTYNEIDTIDDMFANDNYIVYQFFKGDVKIRDIKTGIEIISKKIGYRWLAVSQSIIARAAMKKLSLYDFSLNELNSINFAVDPTSLAISSDEKYIFVGFRNGELKIFDAQTLEELKTLGLHIFHVRHILVSKDNQMLITSSQEELKITNLKTGQCLRKLVGHNKPITSIDISDDSELILTGSREDCTAKLWTINPEIISNNEKDQKSQKSSYCPCAII